MSQSGNSSLQPIYTTIDNVKVRLANKVQFQSGPNLLQDGELPDLLLMQLICDAETAVEQDLRTRYSIPFRSARTGQWVDLPDHSQRAIRRAIDMRSIMEVMRTDFGAGTHIDASKYYDSTRKEYEEYIVTLMGQDAEGKEHKRFRFSPPLQDVRLAHTNIADDGYRGTIINSDSSSCGAEDYAKDQINNPSKSLFGKRGWGGL